MLSKKERLPRSLFSNTLKGRSFHAEHLTLRSISSSLPVSKFSFVVSKKVAKTAPARNLLRRRGYEVIQKHTTKIKGILSCAFFYKTGADKLTFKELEIEIVDLLKKARIL